MDHVRASELEKMNANGNIEENSDDQPQRHFRKQAFISLGPLLLSVSSGATAGFSAILIPQLQHDKVGTKYSTEVISWIAAIASLALVFGNLVSGYLMEKLGRRPSQICLCIVFIGGWITIALAGNIYVILLGRFITGFCQGWLGPLGPVFVGEICSPLNRGFFLAALSLCIASGVFLSHLFGTFLHWSHASFLCALFPLCACIILYFAPESPTWLASKNKVDKCVISFEWYRGTSSIMKTELDKMLLDQSSKVVTEGRMKTLIVNVRKPEFWKPLCIMIVFFVVIQLTGVNVVCAYTTDIMEVIINSKDELYTNSAMLAIDVLRMVASAVACVLLRRQGRRPIAILSGVFTTFALFILAMYLYLIDVGIVKHASSVIALSLIATYVFVSNIGITLLPWNMVGEVFASETKGLGAGLSVMMTSLAYFWTIKTAPAMFEVFGHHGTYLFYGVSTCLGTLFLYIYLPETRNKTLLQIAEYFKYGGKRKDTKHIEAGETVDGV